MNPGDKPDELAMSGQRAGSFRQINPDQLPRQEVIHRDGCSDPDPCR
jgi:hypothetical protein